MTSSLCLISITAVIKKVEEEIALSDTYILHYTFGNRGATPLTEIQDNVYQIEKIQ